MRRPRLKAPPHFTTAFYHCVSRIVNRDFLLHDTEKDKLVHFMRTYESLYHLRILSFCIMSNHFHILVEVPKRPEPHLLPNDNQLVSHVRQYLGDPIANELAFQLHHLRSIENHHSAEALRESWFSRMWNISSFMKVLKQRFSQWFNGTHKRRGTLWEDRYRSVLVEGSAHALHSVAAYIDLNPVRAGIVNDPKDYRWCGYFQALCGDKKARKAISWLTSLPPDNTALPSSSTASQPPREALRRWRCLLFGIPVSHAEQSAERTKKSPSIHRQKISRTKALEVLAQGGKLSPSDYLLCRIRYFSDGAAIGSKNFVDQIFQAFRHRFGPHRKISAHPIRGLSSSPTDQRLYNLRQLRKNVFA